MNQVEQQIKAVLLREDREAVVNAALAALALDPMSAEQSECLLDDDRAEEAADMLMDMVSRLGISLPAVSPESFIKNAIARAKAEILQDVMFGPIDGPVKSFADLHDWVDANCYGGLCDDLFSELGNVLFPRAKGEDDDTIYSQSLMDVANKIQDSVDDWIRNSEEFAAAMKAGLEGVEA